MICKIDISDLIRTPTALHVGYQNNKQHLLVVSERSFMFSAFCRKFLQNELQPSWLVSTKSV